MVTACGFLEPKHRLGHPENCLFSYLNKSFLDSSIEKCFYLILKMEALLTASEVFLVKIQ